MLVKFQRSECKSHIPPPDRLLGFSCFSFKLRDDKNSHTKLIDPQSMKENKVTYPRESRIAGHHELSVLVPSKAEFGKRLHREVMSLFLSNNQTWPRMRKEVGRKAWPKRVGHVWLWETIVHELEFPFVSFLF